MTKYLITLAACLAAAGLTACDSTDVGNPLELVEIQYVVDRYSGYFANAADVTFTERDGSVRTLENRPLPFQQSVQVQRGSTVSLSATVSALPEESGFRVAIWHAGAEVVSDRVAGSTPADEPVTRTLTITTTVD